MTSGPSRAVPAGATELGSSWVANCSRDVLPCPLLASRISRNQNCLAMPSSLSSPSQGRVAANAPLRRCASHRQRVTAMPIDDPATWGVAANAVKTTFDAFRSAIGMIRDVASLGGGTKEQQQAIEKALVTAESSAAIAEAQVAQALGYELCRAHYPPVIMTVVGYFHKPHGGHQTGDLVYECPKCG